MPEAPGGSGSGSGSGSGESPSGGWVSVPCPGFCPIWPCEWVYLNLPAMEYYVPPDPVGRAFPYSGWILLQLGVFPSDESGTATGCNMVWGGTLYTEGDPDFGQEGFRYMRIWVCCNNKTMSYPEVNFDFYDGIRDIGDPDPDINICVRRLCLTQVFCRCTEYTDTNLPGFNWGVASSPKFTVESTCSDISITDFNALTSMEVRCLCNNITCDCTGIPTSLNVSIQCDGSEVGSGTLDFMASSSNVSFPHWEGLITLVPGLGSCTMNAYLVCGTNPPDGYSLTFGQPSCPFPCPCFEFITAYAVFASGTQSGECVPFNITLTFVGWSSCAGTTSIVIG